MSTSAEPVPTIDPHGIYTAAEVGAFLKITERQAQRLMQERKIGIVKLSREHRVSGRQLLDYIERRSFDPEA